MNEYNIFDTVANIIGVPNTQDALVDRLVEKIEKDIEALTASLDRFKHASRFTRKWTPVEDCVETIVTCSRTVSDIEQIISNS